ncbi:MAG: M36 family metallopeptidase [Anaerolineales bacterium]|nr:M36 family metallopeptidase [Anaerolineales bacterium]
MKKIFPRLINLAMAFTLLFLAAWPSGALAADSTPQSADASREPAKDPLDIALAYILSHKEDLGLTSDDLGEMRVVDLYTSEASGLTHIYLRQQYKGIDIFTGDLGVNILPDGSVLNMWSSFESNLAERANTLTPSFNAQQAVRYAAGELGLTLTEPLTVLESTNAADREVTLSDGGVSLESIPAHLVYHVEDGKELRLSWDLSIYQLDAQHYWSMRIDAQSGKMLAQDDYVDHESYKIYPMPVETPNHTSPLPPSDARVIVNNPFNASASPFGWHDTSGVAGAEFTTTQGNNAHAYTDIDANNAPDVGSSPDGGVGLSFNFTIDLTQPPSAYRPAAVTNLFYWNNVTHDLLYLYGFDEAAGNFQENNYGNGGLGSDYVQAEAQDGSGTNNANFFTPADGSNPRMQMYVGTTPNPDVDGDLDNMVIVHEYAHGLSNRLTGGPSNVACLSNAEQMGEGWSDYLGLWMTHRTTDTANTPRGVGTYLFGQPPNGPGIRPAPYTRDMSVNTYTYANLPAMAVPHGVGFVWATMLWDLYWDLVDQYGYNSNLYGPWNSGGNNLALQLVIDGMKIQPCNPGFVDGRNAILQADVALTGGLNQCTIWEAFARRGLGFSASQGSSGSAADGTAAFDLPFACQFPTVSVTPVEQSICVAQDAAYTFNLNSTFSTTPVNLSGVGNPSPSTLTFNPNPVNTLPAVGTLTVGNTASVSAGSYPMTVTASDGTDTVTDTVTLNVFDAAPGAPTLVSPADGDQGVSVSPILAWSALGDAITYTVEVATDAAFTNVVYAADAFTVTHQVALPLPGATELFWRVTAQNPCGPGAASATFSFGTSLLFCSSPALAIPDNNPTGVFDSMVLPAMGNIQDINLWIDATHTWVGDLKFTLDNTAFSTLAIDRPGNPSSTFGCANNNIEVILDDEGVDGPVENQCAVNPALFGNPTPNNPLSVFDGSSTAGTWTLTAVDAIAGDTGTVNQWCLEISAPVTDLEITKSVTPAYAGPGQQVSYTINFANLGGESATGVVITDVVDATLTSLSFTNSGAVATDTGASPAYVWSVEDLSPGESGSIVVTGIVDPNASGHITLTNQVEISTTVFEIIQSNNLAEVSSMVDGVDPETSIDTAPPDPDNSITPDFTFSGSDALSGVSHYECSMDGAPFTTCTAFTSPTLGEGEHTFAVRAVDNAGNADSTPASHTWTIDTSAPSAPSLISPAHNGTISAAYPGVLTWNSVPGAAGYLLTLDGVTMDVGNVTSYQLPLLPVGSVHTWAVAVYDSLSNQSAFTDTWTFQVYYLVALPFTRR